MGPCARAEGGFRIADLQRGPASMTPAIPNPQPKIPLAEEVGLEPTIA